MGRRETLFMKYSTGPREVVAVLKLWRYALQAKWKVWSIDAFFFFWSSIQ